MTIHAVEVLHGHAVDVSSDANKLIREGWKPLGPAVNSSDYKVVLTMVACSENAASVKI